MNEIKISIIIPVYNSEKYLHQCLESVLNQKLEDIQTIIIDDGSTDNSKLIIDEYLKLYPEKFILLSQKNSGPGVARNSGVKIANGKYLMFLDSDDWLEENICELLYNYVEIDNIDILEFSYNIHNEDGYDDYIMKDNQMNLDLNSHHPLEPDYFHLIKNVFWNKIFKADLIKKNNIFFNSERLFEDSSTLPVIYAYSEKFKCTQEIGYNYRKRPGSNVNLSFKYEYLQINVDTLVFLLKEFINRGFAEKHKLFLLINGFGQLFLTNYWIYGCKNMKQRKEYYQYAMVSFFKLLFDKVTIRIKDFGYSPKSIMKFIFVKFARLRFDTISILLLLFIKKILK